MGALLAVTVVVVGSAGAPAGAQTPGLTTSPMFSAPGTTLTVEGPALTCPGGTDEQLLVDSEVAVAPATPAQGAPFAVQLDVVPDAVSDSYPLTASCLQYGGGSTTVASGWLTVTGDAGLPPSDGAAVVSDENITWGQTFTVTGDGFAEGSEVQTWMYSDPVLLGSFSSSATGSIVSQVTMPTGTALGNHTIVLAGSSPSGKPSFLTVGITVGQAAGGQATTTTTTTPAPSAAATGATPATAQTTAGTLPRTGGGIGLALPAAGLVGLGSVFALLARWRERLTTRAT